MAFNIRNPEAVRILRELASLTRESYTSIVLDALREKLRRETGRRAASNLREEVLRIQKRVAGLPVLDNRKPEEILGYDAQGIPR
jgi:antitoxin VapB